MDVIYSIDLFKNPQKLSLNKLHLEFEKKTRILESEETLENLDRMLNQLTPSSNFNVCFETELIKKPALDPYWIEEKEYEKFVPFHLHFDEIENKHNLQNRVFLQQLQFLVDCSFHQFWCYVAYDHNVVVMIKHFLQWSYPPYIISNLKKEFSELHNNIHSYIMHILRRLLSFNVSETEYLDEDVVQRILQDSELFNVENFFIICYLYNLVDSKLTKQINDYCLSLKDGIFLKSINKFLDKISLELEHFINVIRLFTPEVLEEKTLFLFEMASSLHHFLSVCTSAIDVAFTTDLPSNIAYIYQKVYSDVLDILERDSNGSNHIKNLDLFKKWIAYGKYELVNVYHIFTSHCINSIVSLRDNHLKQEFFVEMYISLISNALDNELFILSYNKTFSIRDQFETLVDCVANFDVQQTDYLLQSLDSIINNFNSVRKEEVQTSLSSASDSNRALLEQCDAISNTLSQFLQRYHNKKAATLPKSVSIALGQYYDLTKQLGITDSKFADSLGMDDNVQAVLDILPYLNKEFVLKCLEKYNYNPNDVIAHILSGDLPSDLSDIRDNGIYNGPVASSSTMKEYKRNSLNMTDVLNDTEEKQKIKQFILKASYIFDLDDEYDDRADIGKSLNDSDNESRILRHLGEVKEISEDSESASETEIDKRDTKRDFCTDPALLREKRAQQQKNYKQFKQSKSSDQTEEKKYVKSTKPKHNRKGGATWKRNKGMIPS